MDDLTYPRRIKFRLGRDSASAVAELINREHPNILRLAMTRGIWHWLIPRLPPRIQTLARWFWPTAFLPDRVILKRLRPGWDEQFANEQQMYKKLEALQGFVIPVCYGEARFEGGRALLVSEVPGVMSCEQVLPRLTMDEFRRRLEVAFRALAAFGVIHEDPWLDNVFLVGDGIMLIDLEMVHEEPVEYMELFMDSIMSTLTKRYKIYLNEEDKW